MLTFRVQGSGETFTFRPRRVLMAGYTGRDQASVQAHIDELREHGVPAPKRVPILFPSTADRLTQADEIEVLGERTSGEAEFVLVYHEGRTYVAAGSDHTDREVEKVGITVAKQVCPNVLSREVWPYEDVRDGWDRIVLRSWVGEETSESAEQPASGPATPGASTPRRRYQDGTLAEMLRPEDLEALVRERRGDDLPDGELEGTVIFSGTLAIADGGGFALGGLPFAAELHDPATGRSLRCEYRVRVTAWDGTDD